MVQLADYKLLPSHPYFCLFFTSCFLFQATAYLTSSKKKQVRHTKSMPTLQSWIGDRELTVTQQQLRQQAKPRTRAESLTPWKRVWQHPRSHLPATAVPRLTVPDMWQQRRKVTYYTSTWQQQLGQKVCFR